MKVQYDSQVDALYLGLSEQEADGVIEISEGINVDTTATGGIVGIETLRASEKLDIHKKLSYTITLDDSKQTGLRLSI